LSKGTGRRIRGSLDVFLMARPNSRERGVGPGGWSLRNYKGKKEKSRGGKKNAQSLRGCHVPQSKARKGTREKKGRKEKRLEVGKGSSFSRREEGGGGGVGAIFSVWRHYRAREALY